MTPKLSVIIPCYNIAEHLPKCIESILEQDFGDFELLLINDGSSDTTLKIAEHYIKKDNRIKIHSHENKGVSYTRNTGIKLAQGEYIVFIDGDDYVKPDYLKQLLKGYAEGCWTICGMVNVRNGKAMENGYFKKLLSLFHKKIIHKDDFLEILAYYSLSSPCARIYSKSILTENKIIFPENISYQEDLLFNLEYCKYIRQVSLLDYFGYYYIEHPSSSTGRYHKDFSHIGDLFLRLKTMVLTRRDKEIVQEFMFQTILRKITNIFHYESPKNRNVKINELKDVLFSEPYYYINDYIYKSRINLFLKILLKLKSPVLLFLYFKK